MDRVAQQFAAVKRVSPLVLGRSDRGSTVASDAIALNDHADELIYLEDDQLADSQRQRVSAFSIAASMRQISPVSVIAAGPQAAISLGGLSGFLVKGDCGATGGAASTGP